GHLLAALTAASKVGVEINPAARRVAQLHGLRTVATLQELGEEVFDVVISSHSLEHVPAPRDVLLKLRTHLPPDGQLILLAPLDDWRATSQRTFHPADMNFHLYSWTPQSLGNLLLSADLEPLDLRTMTHAFPLFGPVF